MGQFDFELMKNQRYFGFTLKRIANRLYERSRKTQVPAVIFISIVLKVKKI